MICFIVTLVLSLAMFFCIVRLTNQVKNLQAQLILRKMEADGLRKYLSKNTLVVTCRQRIIPEAFKEKNEEYLLDISSQISDGMIREMAKVFQVEVCSELHHILSSFKPNEINPNNLDPALRIEVPVFRIDVDNLKITVDK